MVILTGLNKLTHCEVPIEVVYFDSFKGVVPLIALTILKDIIKKSIRVETFYL